MIISLSDLVTRSQKGQLYTQRSSAWLIEAGRGKHKVKKKKKKKKKKKGRCIYTNDTGRYYKLENYFTFDVILLSSLVKVVVSK